MKNILILLAVCVVLAACASRQKPLSLYEWDFLSEAEINEIMDNKSLSNEDKARLIELKTRNRLAKEKTSYEQQYDDRMASIISRPVSPVRTPDTVLRVLILPYSDDTGTLNSWKYTFIKAEDGRWIMGDYLIKKDTVDAKILTPLEVESGKR